MVGYRVSERTESEKSVIVGSNGRRGEREREREKGRGRERERWCNKKRGRSVGRATLGPARRCAPTRSRVPKQ